MGQSMTTKENAMNIRETIFAITAGAVFIASPVLAGGPIIPADPEVPASTAQPKRNILPLVLLGVAVAAIVLGNNGNCTEPTPEPDDGC